MAHGSEADRITRGRVISKRKDHFSYEMNNCLTRMKLEEISKPFETDGELAIVQLVAKKTKTLDADIEERIINDRSKDFIRFATIKLAPFLLNQHSS